MAATGLAHISLSGVGIKQYVDQNNIVVDNLAS